MTPLIERQANAWQNRANQQARHVERLDRESCFRCGVRGDLGCSHRRAA